MSIEKVESMKYLGCQIDSTLTNRKHIIEKIRQAVSAAAAIYNNKNYEKNKISGLIKIQQYKIYVRSIMHFGLECFKMDEEAHDVIRKSEM